MEIDSPVLTLPLVGPSFAQRLVKLKISTICDLLFHLPVRYEDYSRTVSIKGVRIGESVTVTGKILSSKNVPTKNGKLVQEIVLDDETGSMPLIWFNQVFLIKSLVPGETISACGKISWWNKKPALISPEYELVKSNNFKNLHTGRLVPIYPETYGISSKWLRSRLRTALDSLKLSEILPSEILERENFLDLKTAFEEIHFPRSDALAKSARLRLAFDELFLLQLSSQVRKRNWNQLRSAHELKMRPQDLSHFLDLLPFTLTQDQMQVIQEILTDLKKREPMNRLLEGDVGSGKTVVAAAAIYITHLNQKKSVLLSPTQILASQHYHTLEQIFSPLGVKISLLTSQNSKKADSQASIANCDLVIGTHALLYEKQLSENPDIGLVVIDEQHRFGVEQRAHFLKGKVTAPHLLTMTATPIPRSITLTLYGELSLSQIKTVPPGRQKIVTWIVPPAKRESAYRWIEATITQNKSQCFIVCPFIEPSESQTTVKSAKTEFQKLTSIFPKLRLQLLHGKMKAKEKDSIMNELKTGKFDILVATPVVEVGIDIPNANIIVIEDAEKFGLAQLHQLRGRVGRGNLKSYCLLFTANSDSQRLKAMETTNSGIELAELDLKLRGPGDIYGTSQHGYADLKAASFTDLALIEKTKLYAQKIVPALGKYPSLQARLKSLKIPTVEPN